MSGDQLHMLQCIGMVHQPTAINTCIEGLNGKKKDDPAAPVSKQVTKGLQIHKWILDSFQSYHIETMMLGSRDIKMQMLDSMMNYSTPAEGPFWEEISD